ncbi:unnamed protein product, partial [Linum tenue]
LLFFCFCVLLLFSLFFLRVESRPFNILKRPDAQSGGSWWADAAFWEGLALGAVKQSGPSPGVGNSFTYAANDGPSPGVGH